MSDIITYLQHFWKDRRSEANVQHEWGTQGPQLHAQIRPGDIIWVVTTGGPDTLDKWRLFQKIVMDRLFVDPICSYLYRIAGKEDQCAVYRLEGQPDLAPLLQRLLFSSGRRITAMGRRIGQALQTTRPLIEADSELFRQHADSLARCR